jgi:hypothetical protein
LELKDYEVAGLISLMSQEGYNIEFSNGEVLVLKAPRKRQDVYEVPYNLEHLKLLLISDTHLCSKYDRLDILRYLYDKADKRGVKHILHSGNSNFLGSLSSFLQYFFSILKCLSLSMAV